MSAAHQLDHVGTWAPLRLKSVLRSRRLTLTDMAQGLGLSVDTVSRWNRGVTRPRGQWRHLAERWLAAHQIDAAEALAPEETTMPPTTTHPPLRLVEAGERAGATAPTTTTTDAEETEMNPFREYLPPDVLAHFNLLEDPFDDPESPDDIFRSPTIKVLERALWNAISRRQIVALVGPPGAGKTKLVRRLYGLVRAADRVRLIAPASLDRKRISVNSLAVAIIQDTIGRDTSNMSQESRSRLLLATLDDLSSAGEFPCLLIDEAHDLSPTALIAIKRIWDSQSQFRQLSVILVGQPPLKARLAGDAQLRELALRTTPLVVPELGKDCAEYLRWRFARVADEEGQPCDADKVFTPDAVEFLAGKGRTPLQVNNLCVQAMCHAFRIGDPTVSAEVVNKV